MSLQDLVNVSISSATVTPTRPGFGTPLLMAYHTQYSDLVRFYSTLSAVASDGFSTASIPYRMAQVAFAQNPAPAKIAIGKRASAMTQTIALVLSSASATDTYTLSMVDTLAKSHQFDFASTGVVNTDASSLASAINTASTTAVVSSGTTPPVVTVSGVGTTAGNYVMKCTTGGTVAGGLAVVKWSKDGGATYTTGQAVSASFVINGVTVSFASGTLSTDNVWTWQDALGKAVASSATVTVTQYAGALVDFQNWNPLGTTTPIMTLQDNTTDPGIATDLSNALAFAPAGSVYGVALDSNSFAEITACAASVEAQTLLFIWNNSDTLDISNTTSSSNIFHTQKLLAHARSGGLYSGSSVLSYSGLAWLSKTLPANPGSLTFMYKTLASVPADPLSETAQLNLNTNNGNYYITIAGINITINGTDAAGEFFDIVWGTDALTSQIQIDIFAALAGAPKIPYTDLGVDILKSIVAADLALFSSPQFNFIATNPAPTVSAPTVASISATTRAARIFPNISFSGKLAGAIHTLTIQGVLTA